MKEKNDYKLFTVYGLFWLASIWLAFMLAIFNIFYWWLFAICFALSIVWGGRYFFKLFVNSSLNFKLLNLFLLTIIVIFSIFTVPTIFTGRDQGAISQAAIRLSQNHSPFFSTPASEEFYKTYPNLKQKKLACLKNTSSNFISNLWCEANVSSKALHFPGFYYNSEGKLITQFPLPYTSFLAIFYSFFGINGFIIANAILMHIFLLAIYLLAGLFLKTNRTSTRLWLLAVLLTSFPFFWFAKFTLTENMALAIIWFSILQLTFLTKPTTKNISQKKLYFLSWLASIGLIIFIRIEGIALFLSSMLIIFLNKNTRYYIKKNYRKTLIAFILLLMFFFIISLNINIYFYKTIFKAVFDNFLDSGKQSVYITSNSFNQFFYLLKAFGLYGILFPSLLGIFSIDYFLKKRMFNALIPLVVNAPTFIYFINPQISSDHPWMLRRFVFAILPALFFYAILFINDFKKRTFFYSTIGIIILFNLPALFFFATYSENINLLTDTRRISLEFSSKDLILIDKDASGHNWSMMPAVMDSLLDRNAVYFFNPDDLAKINLERFEKIYLIAPADKADFYTNALGSKIIFYKKYSIQTNQLSLKNKSKIVSFPRRENSSTNGTIFKIIK